MQIEHGADYGWPFCYFDGAQKKLMLAPEYGGDGTKVGLRDKKRAPVAYFPGHWAPDGLTFYSGSSFPAHYRGGAFIAFHGSWNRAPCRRADTSWRSSRSRATRRAAPSKPSPTGSPARQAARCGGAPAGGRGSGPRWRPLHCRQCARPRVR